VKFDKSNADVTIGDTLTDPATGKVWTALRREVYTSKSTGSQLPCIEWEGACPRCGIARTYRTFDRDAVLNLAVHCRECHGLATADAASARVDTDAETVRDCVYKAEKRRKWYRVNYCTPAPSAAFVLADELDWPLSRARRALRSASRCDLIRPDDIQHGGRRFKGWTCT